MEAFAPNKAQTGKMLVSVQRYTSESFWFCTLSWIPWTTRAKAERACCSADRAASLAVFACVSAKLASEILYSLAPLRKQNWHIVFGGPYHSHLDKLPQVALCRIAITNPDFQVLRNTVHVIPDPSLGAEMAAEFACRSAAAAASFAVAAKLSAELA